MTHSIHDEAGRLIREIRNCTNSAVCWIPSSISTQRTIERVGEVAPLPQPAEPCLVSLARLEWLRQQAKAAIVLP